MNRVEIRFGRTWDRKLGGWISILTVLGLLGWGFASKPHPAG